MVHKSNELSNVSLSDEVDYILERRVPVLRFPTLDELNAPKKMIDDPLIISRIPPSTRENVLTDDEVLARVEFAEAKGSMRSLYHKVMDREAWTHAIVSAAVVLEIDKGTCRKARIVLGGVAPIPWRVSAVEKMLTGQKITPELAASAAEAAVAGANPLAKNKYKVPLTREIVARGIMQAAARA